jgi:hypothetical protein
MREDTIRPDRLKRLRQICLALPEATEKVAAHTPSEDRLWRAIRGRWLGVHRTPPTPIRTQSSYLRAR